ncbi:glycoside hydrolase family 16 protein [Pseudarthrobacter sp. NamB4]|uniref:glycoside hydrolase family 16 protein n=1 Tax=Pseudarthrobacter sp. NamB4 TaxID=2576837 RepID=UPI001484F4D9|nr:glycoside hydrolase family 16 protein [Pseudarthrobacter sp. NamB4]
MNYRSKLIPTVALCATATFLLTFAAAIPAGMPVGDLPGWKQTFVQNFDSPASLGQVEDVYGKEMRFYSGHTDTSGNGTYDPRSVLSVSDGKLNYLLHTAKGKPRVATVVPFGYQGQTYGRYSIRFRTDHLPGYKIAFMLWPVSDDWNEGEIDWPEGELSKMMMYANSKVKGSLDEGGMSADPPEFAHAPTDSADWHVATTEWTPGKVKWFWDGILIGETTLPWGVPDTDFRWTLQAETEVGEGARIPNSRTAGLIQVDWAVQYAYAPAD